MAVDFALAMTAEYSTMQITFISFCWTLIMLQVKKSEYETVFTTEIIIWANVLRCYYKKVFESSVKFFI
jgi:hypothetical protein